MNPIQENIWWTIHQATMLSDDAKQKPLKRRNGYYKASFFFAASAIEAMAFLIVRNFYKTNKKGTYPTETNYTLLHTLPNSLFSKITGSVGIYEKKTKQFTWKDDLDFRTLNQIILDNNLCGKAVYNKLEKIRKQRNRVHMQSLEQKDHQYTQKDVERAQSIIADLLPLAE